MHDRTDHGNDGRFPAGVPVLTPYPVTAGQARGGRDSWPWVPAVIESQCGPGEWALVIEAHAAAVVEDGTGIALYPIVFRDASEIRLPDPTVEELREVFFREHGGAL